jgi:O-antigen ligase
VDRRTVTLGRLALLGVASAGFVVVADRVVDTAQIERIQSLEAEVSDGTLGGRLPLWRLAWDRFTDRPVTGIGASTFRLEAEKASGRGRAPHSTFVGVLVELGTVGLVLFLTVIGSAARSAARLEPELRRIWVAIAVAWSVASFSLSWETKKITWFLAALVATQAVAREHVATHDASPSSRPAPAR